MRMGVRDQSRVGHRSWFTSSEFFHVGRTVLPLSSLSKAFRLHESFFITHQLVITTKPPEESDTL